MNIELDFLVLHFLTSTLHTSSYIHHLTYLHHYIYHLTYASSTLHLMSHILHLVFTHMHDVCSVCIVYVMLMYACVCIAYTMFACCQKKMIKSRSSSLGTHSVSGQVHSYAWCVQCVHSIYEAHVCMCMHSVHSCLHVVMAVSPLLGEWPPHMMVIVILPDPAPVM